jgi:hypothetical protein
MDETTDEELMEIEAVEEGSKKPLDATVAFVKERFERAKTKKLADETRFLKAYKNFRGLYDKELAFTDKEVSKVFVKVTKTKVLAAVGQIVEVLFGTSNFPISVDQTKLPDGVADSVHFDPAVPEGAGTPAPKGPAKPTTALFGDQPLPPGATAFDLGPLKENLAPVEGRLKAGPGVTPTAVTFNPAYVAAKKMEKTIQDQLDECGASKELRASVFEQVLFGTLIAKGPMALDKEYPKWDDTGKYAPITKTVPTLSHVSVWNFYPDPDAANMDQAEYVVERHKLSRKDLKELLRRPHFLKDKIDAAIESGPDYHQEYWETVMEDTSTHPDIERWEVLEYWGYVPAMNLREQGLNVDKKIDDNDMVSANIWISRGEVLRAVLNPFTPQRIPYFAAPYEANPYSFFGIGVAENMEDTQLLMNGFMRMAVDNAALSGNLVFEVDESNLTPGQDLEIYPGKVFKRQSGAPGQAIFATEFPNVSQQNMALFDKARFLADEATGLPSYSYGQTGIQGVGRTASGISMLMNAAHGSIRTVVKNIDDYFLGPLGKAFFAFNMQWNFDPEIKGDLEVSARGTESLMANEVKSQRLMQFLGLVSNPILAPFAKLDMIVREIAKTLDLDVDKVTNNMAEAAIQAEVLKAMVPAMAGPPPGQAGPGVSNPGAPMPGGVGVGDTQGGGGGSIGTGSVPTPGTEGFSANGVA